MRDPSALIGKETLAGMLLQLEGEGTFTAMRRKDLSAKANVARAKGDTLPVPGPDGRQPTDRVRDVGRWQYDGRG